mmetsp:Transcript_6350/g.19047  ORF Transcript_6350/g.19047 Transcript_6350/m.19047 type:complete len:235 (+) Transcript_6350:34-738(+)
MTLAFGSRHTRRLLLPTKRCLRRPPRCRRRRRRSPPRRRRASQRRPSRPSPSLVSTSHPLGWSRTWMRRCLWVGWRSRRWRREAPSATRFAPSVMLRAARSAPSAVFSVRSAGSGRITRLVSRRAQCWSWVSRMRSMPSTRSGARRRRPRQRRRRRRRRRRHCAPRGTRCQSFRCRTGGRWTRRCARRSGRRARRNGPRRQRTRSSRVTSGRRVEAVLSVAKQRRWQRCGRIPM